MEQARKKERKSWCREIPVNPKSCSWCLAAAAAVRPKVYFFSKTIQIVPKIFQKTHYLGKTFFIFTFYIFRIDKK
jgi:hypothetical protein